jgi:hypothetical protein
MNDIDTNLDVFFKLHNTAYDCDTRVQNTFSSHIKKWCLENPTNPKCSAFNKSTDKKDSKDLATWTA